MTFLYQKSRCLIEAFSLHLKHLLLFLPTTMYEGSKIFIERWKELDEQATDVNESIQQLFYYSMLYYRALDKDTKTTTPGIRKYFAANKFDRC